jgi:hypothetical protein
MEPWRGLKVMKRCCKKGFLEAWEFRQQFGAGRPSETMRVLRWRQGDPMSL